MLLIWLPSAIEILAAIFKGFGIALIEILQVFANYLQSIADAGRKVIESQAFAMNATEAKNPMPSPSEASSEEAYVQKFMESDAMRKEFPDEQQRAAVAYSKWRESKDSATNAGAVDYQALETAEVVIPVIRADVLTYKPGELGSSTTIGKEGAKVFYSEAALKDPEFLETVKRSPFSVSTHEKNTNEWNRDVDGWPIDAWFDEKDKTVYAKGYVIGADNIKYVKQNKFRDGFGTSAFIKFIDMKRSVGTTTTGTPFDTVATKMSCSHIAILENIRDKKNVIVAINALQEHEDVSTTLVIEKSLSVRNSGGSMEGKDIKGAVKDAMNEIAKEKETEELKNQLDAANKELEGYRNSRNAKNAEEEKPEEKKAENAEDMKTENAEEEEKKDEAENAKNAIASEGLIAEAAEILRTTFKVPPTLVSLAKDFDIDTKGKSKLQLATALNAKIAEHKKPLAEATNSTESSWEALTKAL